MEALLIVAHYLNPFLVERVIRRLRGRGTVLRVASLPGHAVSAATRYVARGVLDAVFSRPGIYDAFTNPLLALFLRSRGVDHVYVYGEPALPTALGAREHGFYVSIISPVEDIFEALLLSRYGVRIE